MASGKPLQTVHDCDQNVLQAPVLEFVHHRQPELRAFVLRHPQAQDLTAPIPGDAQGDVDRFVLDCPAVRIPDFHPEGVEDHDGIHPVQRPPLPFPDLVQHRISDAADQVGRDLQAVEVEQMRLDVPNRQPGGVEPDDLVIHPVDPGLALLHQFRLEAAVAIPRDRHRQCPVLPL